MRKGLAIAALGVMLLGGCTAAETQATPEGAPESAESQSQSAPVEETTAPATPEQPTLTEEEALQLKYLRTEAVLLNMEATSDDVLLAASWLACDLFAQGQTYDVQELNLGDEAYMASKNQPENRNDATIAGLASQTLCTDYDITKY